MLIIGSIMALIIVTVLFCLCFSCKIYNNVIYSYNRKLGIYKKILEIYNTQYTGIKDLDKILVVYMTIFRNKDFYINLL